jgi:YHS domain-containing protein
VRRVVALLLIVASTATLPARLLAQSTAPAPVESNPVPIVRKPAEWNLGDQRLAIEGYDAVAYFPEGGGQPKSGDAALQVEHGGVLYRFATAAHRDLFLKDPARYEPAFGGWCAYAMGQKRARGSRSIPSHS